MQALSFLQTLLPALIVGAMTMGSVPTAWAGVFSVTPVRIYMAPRDRAVAVTLVNESPQAVVLQADIHTWRQTPDGVDELEPTEDLILSPPIVTLPPQGRQVVRLARLQPAPTLRQLTYRLVVREVPEALAARDKSMEVPIALALNMPVFITPKEVQRQVDCAVDTGEGRLQALCRNIGTAYAQVRDVQLHQGERLVARFEGGSYILPGARKALVLTAQHPTVPGEARLTVVFDDFKTETFVARLP